MLCLCAKDLLIWSQQFYHKTVYRRNYRSDIDCAEPERPVRALCDAETYRGQTRGKQKTRKVCKKHVNFTKWGEFKKVGEIIISRNLGENVLFERKQTEILNFESMTKKVIRYFGWRKPRNVFWTRVKLEI